VVAGTIGNRYTARGVDNVGNEGMADHVLAYLYNRKGAIQYLGGDAENALSSIPGSRRQILGCLD
jgi:hypothetical protein